MVAALTNTCDAQVKQIYQQVRSLDLSLIRNSLTSKHYLLGRWPSELALQCEILYQRFFTLCIAYPDTALVPTRDIDAFWHQHILHTQQYISHCQQVAGRYIHHQPSADADRNDALISAFKQTKDLYQRHFNEALTVIQWKNHYA